MGKRRGVSETTPEIRNRMVGMYEAGLGLSAIAAALNCSQRTVKRWLNRFDKEGTVETRDRCGRKRITSQQEDDAIVRLATEVPLKAAKAVLPALGLNCSVDTVRDRLHKAGFYNWNPSKKYVQEIAVLETDGVKIEETVWRPTGSQSIKKKLAKETGQVKSTKPKTKKKKTPPKNKPKESTSETEVSTSVNTINNVVAPLEEQPNFSFSSLQSEQPQPENQINEMPYVHSLNLMPQNQPTYHHPGLNISQNWSIDLGQNAHYMTNHHNPMHFEQNPINIHHELHQTSFTQHLQDQINSSMQISHSIDQVKMNPLYIDHQQHTSTQGDIDPLSLDQHQGLSGLSPEKLSESQDDIINVCSDACSNSSSPNLIVDRVSSNNKLTENQKNNITQTKRTNKKKGGKVKGTLETSVEIRNHMIGMSEAGLTTLSIALSLNRSERTVKRWLDRWRKEGSVQTKERKGRKRITTKEEDEAIIAMASKHPLTSAKDVAPALGLKCSVDTVRERLHQAGFHSWKLGKKQGEGNAVHTVKVWQTSGNRPSKVKLRGNKKKKLSSKKINQSPKNNSTEEKNKIDCTNKSSPKINQPSTESIPKLFLNQPNESDCVVGSSYNLVMPTPLQLQQNVENIHIPPICSQPFSTGIMQLQQRPDCRLAFPSTYSHIPPQPAAQISHPSCMMSTGHMEQTDPLNFEPYVWSF